MIRALVTAAWLGLALLPAHAADTPQPRVVEIHPGGEVAEIPSAQVFLLRLSRPLTAAPQAECNVEGIRSNIPVQTLAPQATESALRAAGITPAPEWLALQCRTRFPDAARVSLIWRHPERADENNADRYEYWRGQVFHFIAKSELPFSMLCSRENESAGCNPLAPVVLRFTATLDPKQRESIQLRDARGRVYRPSVSANEDPEGYYGYDGNEVRFQRLPENAVLTVVLPPRLKDYQGKPFRAADSSRPYRFKMASYPPLVKFAASFGIIEHRADPALPVTLRNLEPMLKGAPNVDASTTRAKLRTLRLRDDVEIIRALREVHGWQSRDGSRAYSDWYDSLPPPDADEPNSLKSVPSEADARAHSMLAARKGVVTRELPKAFGPRAMEVIGVPLPETGFYVAEAESRKLGQSLLGKNLPMYVRTAALVTNLAAHLHYSDSEALVWVTTLDRARPVARAQVRLRDCRGKLLLEGKTDAQGVARLSGALPQQDYQCPLFAFAQRDGDLTFVRSDWTRGIEMWRFHIEEWQPPSKLLGHTVLARNLLRPGETVHMKHYARQVKPLGLDYPARDQLPTVVDIIHSGSNERYSVPLTWDARGNAETVWKLPAGAKRGEYQIQLGRFGTGGRFRVEDFRLPVYKAEVALPGAPFVAPEQVAMHMRLGFLAGGAAGGEKVTVRQRLADFLPQFSQFPDHVFGEQIDRWSYWYRHVAEPESEGETSMESEALGEDRSLALGKEGSAVATVRFDKAPAQPKTLITDMEYRDPNGETYTAQARAAIWPAAQLVGIKTDYWAAVKDKASAELIVIDVNGKPVANAKVAAKASQHGWISHRKRTVGGFYAYHHEEKTQELGEVCSGMTDKLGRFNCQFAVPMTGELVLRASTTDAKGRTANASTSMWAFSGDEIWFRAEDHDRIDLIAEAKRYEPGDTARLQVRLPFKQATALVAVMRSGGTLDYFVQPLSSKNPVIEFPVKPEYAPNVYVSALVVRGRVAAPAATALVDLARPAFKLGLTSFEVGARKHTMRVTLATDKPVYQTREKARVKIKVEGAADARGQRTLPAQHSVTLFAIDEALLELMPNPTWNALTTMLAKRSFGFQTASAQMQVVGKRHYGRKALPPGGGGGKLPTRELFDTLIAWQTTVMLDAKGEGEAVVPINDSLTRFRIVAVSDADADQFGVGQVSIIATRDLQLFSGLPPVVREGDQYRGQFTLRNTTQRDMQVTVKGTAGTQALSAQQVTLAPGESSAVAWQVAAPKNATQLEWHLEASERGGGNDSLRIRQAIEPALLPLRFENQYLELKGERTLVLDKPAGAVAGKGEVLVSISPKLGTSAASVRDYMRSYPFFCLEQRTSKAVSLKDPGLWAIIENSIDRYVSPNGLVNYYPTDGGEGYDVLTAFVLSATHEVGWQVPQQAREKMLAGLQRFVAGQLTQRYDYYRNDSLELTERKIAALEALSRYGHARPEHADTLKLELKRLSTRALSDWARVLHRTQWPQREQKLNAVLGEIRNRYKLGARGAVLTNAEAENRWWLMYSDDVTAVRLILLALEVPGMEKDLDALVQGAVHRQQHGHWLTTQANVWGSIALEKYGQRVAQSALSGKTMLTLGTQRREVDWAKQVNGDSFVLPLPDERTRLQLSHQGHGAPMVQVLASAFAPLTAPVAQGAQVTKLVTPVKQAKPGVWSAGDVARIALTFHFDAPQGWVVVSDPIPAGATILGGLPRQGDQESAQTNPDRWWWYARPMYVERTFSVYRAYYEYLHGGTHTVEYEIRLNNPGRFQLPPTHVEAMYVPQVYADQPNAVWEVK